MKEPENSDILSINNQELREFYIYHLARYFFVARFARKKKVLDVGCAYGQGSYLLSQAGAKKVVGIDLSIKAVQYCQKTYKSRHLCFTRQDTLNCRFPDHYFNIICAFDIIEHLSKPDLFLREMSRLLKPNGTLFIITPNRGFFHLKNSRPLWPYHVREFSLCEFKSLLEERFKNINFLGQHTSKGRYATTPQKSLWGHVNDILRGIYIYLPLSFQKMLVRATIQLHRIKNAYLCRPYPLKIKDIHFLSSPKAVKSSRTIFAVCRK